MHDDTSSFESRVGEDMVIALFPAIHFCNNTLIDGDLGRWGGSGLGF